MRDSDWITAPELGPGACCVVCPERTAETNSATKTARIVGDGRPTGLKRLTPQPDQFANQGRHNRGGP